MPESTAAEMSELADLAGVAWMLDSEEDAPPLPPPPPLDPPRSLQELNWQSFVDGCVLNGDTVRAEMFRQVVALVRAEKAKETAKAGAQAQQQTKAQ